jgi:hypothetical protein
VWIQARRSSTSMCKDATLCCNCYEKPSQILWFAAEWMSVSVASEQKCHHETADPNKLCDAVRAQSDCRREVWDRHVVSALLRQCVELRNAFGVTV